MVANRKKLALQEAYAKEFEATLHRIVGAPLEDFVKKLIAGNEKVGKAFAEMGRQMVTNFTNMLIEMTMAAIEHWAAMKILQALGLGEQQSKTTATNTATATSDAFVAAANALASVPYPMNIPASATMLGMGLAFAAGAAAAGTAGTVASAAQGMLVPADNTFAMLHAKEMVLPAHLSTGIQSMLGQKAGETVFTGGTHTGGDTNNYKTSHFHNRFEIHVNNPKVGKQEIIDTIRQAMGRGTLGPNDV